MPGDDTFLETCLACVQLLERSVHLTLFAGELEARMTALVNGNERIAVRGFGFDSDAGMVAADVVICRGGHNTLWELASLGIPSISVPPKKSNNLMAEVYAANMRRRGTTWVMDEEELTADQLAAAVLRLLDTDQGRQQSENGLALTHEQGDDNAASILAGYLERAPARMKLRG